MKTWRFWVDNLEEKSAEDLLAPELELEDDSNLGAAAMAGWAADELLIEDESVTLIVNESDTDEWQVITLSRGNWHALSSEKTTADELMGNYTAVPRSEMSDA